MGIAALSIATLLFLGLFIAVSRISRASIWNGFLFVCLLGSLAALLLVVENATGYAAMSHLLALFAVFLLFLFMFGGYILVGLLFINARLVLKRERFSLANCIGLILAIALSALTAVSWLTSGISLPKWAEALRLGLSFLIAYYTFHILNYLLCTAMCCMARQRRAQQYVVVLGCSSRCGAVSPMLASRVDKGIAFYRRQRETAKPPKLVFSGGKGSDEPVSEADAMLQYALGQGVPREDVMLEAASRNTLQNMKYSKELMDADAAGQPYSCVFVTSGYHLLRSGIYARMAGLRGAVGVGARTAPYYLPNAILREYIAYLVLYKKLNIVMCAALFAGGAAAALLSQRA
jgi:uncharacterized SAM-binding protein YcdF (DUF218 family)